MKRVIITLIAILMVLNFSALAVSAADDSSNVESLVIDFPDFEASGEGVYIVDTEDSGIITYYLAITNYSDKKREVKGTVLANSAKQTIASQSVMDYVLGPGETSMHEIIFEELENFDHFDFKLSSDKPMQYAEKRTVLNGIETELEERGGKLIVTATNKGKNIASFVEVYALFFDEQGKLTAVDSRYYINEEGELDPGESISKEIECKVPYTSYKLFVGGSASHKAGKGAFFELMISFVAMMIAFTMPGLFLIRLYFEKKAKQIETWILVDAEIKSNVIKDLSYYVRAMKHYRYENAMTVKFSLPDGSIYEKGVFVITEGENNPFEGVSLIKLYVDPECTSEAVPEIILKRNGLLRSKTRRITGLLITGTLSVVTLLLPWIYSVIEENESILMLYVVYALILSWLWVLMARLYTREVRSILH